MEESLAEAERLRQVCRAAAAASATRSREESVSMDHVGQAVESAKAVSDFVKNAGFNGRSYDGGVPGFLQHLSCLKPAETQGLAEATLPGAVEDDSGPPGPEALPLAVVGQRPEQRSRSATPPSLGMSPPQAVQAVPVQMHGSSAPVAGAAPQSLVSRPAHDEASPSFAAIVSDEAPPMLLFGDHSPGRSPSAHGLDELSQASSDDDTETTSDGWPPKPPLLRFKMRELFSSRFKTSEELKLMKEANKSLRRVSEITEVDVNTAAVGEMKDIVIGWLNHYFELTVSTEFQIEVGFPVIVMLLLDAIYPFRVPWCSVDWKLAYKRALTKNFHVLKKTWDEVNMDKAREFRVENTALRLESMQTAPLKEKLAFFKQLKRWFDVRIHHAPPFEPLLRRREIAELCRVRGHTFEFPPWIKHDANRKAKLERGNTHKFAEMPEYKRLIWFLGSPEHQTM